MSRDRYPPTHEGRDSCRSYKSRIPPAQVNTSTASPAASAASNPAATRTP